MTRFVYSNNNYSIVFYMCDVLSSLRNHKATGAYEIVK